MGHCGRLGSSSDTALSLCHLVGSWWGREQDWCTEDTASKRLRTRLPALSIVGATGERHCGRRLRQRSCVSTSIRSRPSTSSSDTRTAVSGAFQSSFRVCFSPWQRLRWMTVPVLVPSTRHSLFQCSAGTCLSSWEEVAFGVSVSSLQWSTSRPGVFFASFSNAQVLVWDLTEQTHVRISLSD